ncbi:MAG TPA: alpha/beta hydrolase [Flavobacteriales bacterium]|nr:alpha/beta hydrolase [Flavobacteriales bacterium]
MSYSSFEIKSNDDLLLAGQSWMPSNIQVVICLVHGLGEHIGRFAPMADYMNNNGTGIMGMDLRGHGKSEGPRGHTPTYNHLLDDISLLVDKAKSDFPNVPIFLFGHSMGGNIVTNYVLRRNTQGISGAIFSSPWYRLAFEPPAFKVKLGKMMNGIFPSFTQRNEIDTNALCSDPAVIRAYEEDPLVHDKISAGLFFTVYSAGLWALENANKLSIPALLTHGDKDALTSCVASSEFANTADEKVELKIWDGLKHEPHNEPEKEKVFGFLCDWVKSKTPE